jgi:polyhydroxyalkanoate synthesis regulator phasin
MYDVRPDEVVTGRMCQLEAKVEELEEKVKKLERKLNKLELQPHFGIKID